MSEVTNNSQNQNQSAADDYFGSGKQYTLKAGLNQNVKVKGWSIEKNDNNGKVSTYLKITYVHPVADVDPEEWSTMNELLNFPSVRLNKTEVDKNNLKYGFINPLRGFVENFAPTDEVKTRFVDVLAKLGIKDFDLVDVTSLTSQLETLVKGWFDLAEKKGLFQLEGTLVCGYGVPKTDNDGNVKQYLTPAKYGAQGCFKPAFRTNNDTELPAEKTVFSDESDKKYNYWSYTRTSKSSEPAAPPAATPTTSEW